MINRMNGRSRRVLVTDAGRGNAIAIIRSLGRRGYHVVAADSDEQSLGFHSRFTHDRLVYPPPTSEPERYSERMLDAVKQKKIDLVIPVTDLTIQPLARVRQPFESLTQLAMPDDDRLQAVTDKGRTVAIATELGVPVPKTIKVSTAAEASTAAAELGWPLVVKPQESRKLRAGKGIDSFQVTYAGDAAQLETTMANLEGRCQVLLQQYCSGTGYGVELLMHEGRPLAAFQHKRLREIPVTGGASAYRESVRLDPVLFRHAVDILQRLQWTGLAMVEYKSGPTGPVLMEINGRVWGSLPLAVASGMDFPALLAQLYLDGPDSITPKINSEYKLGVRCRDLQRDLNWIGQVLMQRQRYPFLRIPERKRAVMALLGLLNPRRKFDLLVADDPMPGIIEIPRIIKKFRSKVGEDV